VVEVADAMIAGITAVAAAGILRRRDTELKS
jgi:hypothetical protein